MKTSSLTSYHYLNKMQYYQEPVARIAALDVEIPSRVVDNDMLVDMLDAPPRLKRKLAKLIYRATKCQSRAYAEPGLSPSDLAVAAARKVLDRAGHLIDAIDTLIFASTDMDTLEPATANIVQHKLGMKIGNAFDVTNACNSFLQAINVGNSMIATGAAHRVLIVSGEIGSYVCNRQINHVDELSYKMGGLTLGDAGAAMILEPAEGNIGIQEINLLSLGQHWEMCHVPETTDWRQKPDGTIHGWFYLDMPELAKVAKRESVNYFKEYKTMRRELYGEAMMLDSLAHLVPHQISRKFIEDICSALDFDASMIPITADILGNTASTSIPLVLHGLMEQSKLDFDSGQEVFLYGAASGFGIGHIRVKF